MRLKICGLTRREDIDAVNAAMPEYVGFVFARSSGRRVTPDTAARLAALLDPNIIPVGVFAGSSAEEIAGVYASGAIRLAQLHGGEGADVIAELKSRGIPVIQAIRYGRGDKMCGRADFYLFDAPNGGCGEAFDWSELPKTDKPAFLAGGIDLQSIEAAMKTGVYALDISSGAETAGLKDPEKIKRLASAISKRG
jgi:phosphoribosylanthranilate isomerase